MSRVIRFRGLNAHGEFVYGLPSSDAPNSTNYYNEYSCRVCWHPEKGGCANQPIKNGTMGQFTGLLDANGVEIYEGDILKDRSIAKDRYDSGEFVYGVIEFFKSGFYEIYRHSDGKVYHEEIDGIHYEVVGNIHQNPELLK